MQPLSETGHRPPRKFSFAIICVSRRQASLFCLPAALDRDIGNNVWSGDGRLIYFSSQTEGDIPLFSVPAKGGNITKIFGNDNGINDLDVRGDKVVYALTETDKIHGKFIFLI
ncbi:MAG: hypothetical protein U5K54_07520 [Cytophagales bacterium]|nr:hypothetical protein [Cytophagales bacterium]